MNTAPLFISDEKKKEMAAIIILYKMYNNKIRYNIILEGDDKYLEPIFEFLLAKENIIIDHDCYAISEKGRKTYDTFIKKYTDFLVNFDVYSAVDLEEGIFAFEKYFEIEDENVWEAYIEEERFEDLRIAVALHKGIDPIEIVFMSFLNDGFFSSMVDENGWQFDLVSGKLWEDIIKIVKESLKKEDLGYQDGEEFIEGGTVLADIIRQGAKLNEVLWGNEQEFLKEEHPEILEFEEGVFAAYQTDDRHINSVWTRKYF